MWKKKEVSDTCTCGTGWDVGRSLRHRGGCGVIRHFHLMYWEWLMVDGIETDVPRFKARVRSEGLPDLVVPC